MVLHHLEHLVSKRVAHTIIFTRLPTGHTHDDVDGCFGIIKKYVFSVKPIDCFSQFRRELETAFRDKDGTRCIVHDWIVLIPDYRILYKDSLDKRLSDLHILESTMHQWKFEAVKINKYFPMGVKTCYKPYSSNEVVVFEQRPKAMCLSPIGVATGLEPFRMFTCWRPAQDDDASRPGIEGYYLNIAMPNRPEGSLPPVPFPEGSSDSIKSSIADIRVLFATDHEVRNEWNEWFERYAPRSDDVNEYLTFMGQQNPPIPYKIPLKNILLSADVRYDFAIWMNKPLAETPINKPLIEWPEQLVAATHSVRSEMNRNPLPARIYSPADQYLVSMRNNFAEKVASVYGAEDGYRAAGCTKPMLISKIWRKVSLSGEVSGIAG